jgi:4-hydroxybenzoate polyprenyltransferase
MFNDRECSEIVLPNITGCNRRKVRDMYLLHRWWLYVNETFLPFSRTALCTLLYAGNMFLYQALIDRHPLVLTHDMLPGVTTLVLMFLYYRIQDEFKDQVTDRSFFPHRPVPSGRVSLQDLRILIWLSIALMVAVNILWGAATGMFFVFLGFSVLMHYWFFMEKILSRNRLLALATHAPFGFFADLFVVAIYTNRCGMPLLSSESMLTALWFSLGGFYWDIGRKTRAPQEEMHGYQTYSSIIGYRGASALALAFIGVQGLLLYWLPVSGFYIVFFCACSAACAACFLRFFIRPERGSRYLQTSVELFGAGIIIGILIDLAVSRGLQWTN